MNKCTNILLLLTHFVLISCSELDEYINMKTEKKKRHPKRRGKWAVKGEENGRMRQ